MDANRLAGLLRCTYTEAGERRISAEKELKKLTLVPGCQATLLQIVTHTKFELPVRQSACIFLKNTVTQYWGILDKSGKAYISPKDREIIKKNILQAIILQPHQRIRVQLLECLYMICRMDFPKDFPSLLPGIMMNLQSRTLSRVYGSLCALKLVFKKYEYKSKKNGNQVSELVETTFPVLVRLLGAVITTKNPNQESYEMLRLLIKMFRIATFLTIPKYLKNFKNLNPWIQSLGSTVERPVQKDILDGIADDKSLTALPQMKCKKWSLIVLSQLYQRWGREAYMDGHEEKEFARKYTKTYGKLVFQNFMNVLKRRMKGEAVSNRMVHTTFDYLVEILKQAHEYQLMRPELPFLIKNAVLGTLCLSKEDIRLWKEDPTEYIKNDLDVMDVHYDPRASATRFIRKLVEIRTKDALPLSLSTINKVFETYHRTPVDQRDYRMKEGAMRLLASLGNLLLSEEKYYLPIEKVLIQHVIPEFKSRFGFLRAQACSVVGAYSRLDWKNQGAFSTGVKSVCDCLTSKELPLKLQAVKAMSKVVRNEAVVRHITPYLNIVFKEYFVLIEDVPSEDIIITLETLITQIADKGASEKIAPFAIDIARRMATLFVKIVSKNDNLDSDDMAFTAIRCLRAMSTLLVALAPLTKKGAEQAAGVYNALQDLFGKVIDATLVPEGQEFFDDVLDIINGLVKFSRSVSPKTWSFLPRIIKIYKEYCLDYSETITVTFGKYVMYDTPGLLKRPTLIKQLLAMCHHMFFPVQQGSETIKMQSEAKLLVQAQYASKLISILFMNLRTNLNALMPDILGLLCKRYARAQVFDKALDAKEAKAKEANEDLSDIQIFRLKNQTLKAIIFETIATMMYTNPTLFLQTCSKMKCTKHLFKLWIECLPYINKDRSCLQASIIGLMSLSLLPRQAIPPELLGQDKAMLHLLNTGVRQLEELKTLEKKDEDEDTDEDGYESDELREFQDIDNTEDTPLQDTQEINILAEHIRDVFELKSAGALNDKFLTEFFEKRNKLDKFAFFSHCMNIFPQKNLDIYKAWVATLNERDRQAVQALVNLGKQRAQENNSKN